MIRVALVDDHAVMRAGFKMVLDAADDITVVGEAGDGRAAVRMAEDAEPDVICMDVQMPDMDGLEATRAILSRPGVTARIVIVTTFDRDEYLFAALRAGASGFILKNAGPEELVGAVRAAASGDALLAPEVTKRVIARFAESLESASREHASGAAEDSAADEASADRAPEAAALTDREREILHLLAQAMSNAEIAGELFIGEATVKTHVSNVLLKLGVRDRVGAVVYAHRHGLA